MARRLMRQHNCNFLLRHLEIESTLYFLFIYVITALTNEENQPKLQIHFKEMLHFSHQKRILEYFFFFSMREIIVELTVAAWGQFHQPTITKCKCTGRHHLAQKDALQFHPTKLHSAPYGSNFSVNLLN